MEQVYLIIDSGGGSTRAALVTLRGELLGIRSVQNFFFIEPGTGGRRKVRFAPDSWLQGVRKMAAELCRSHPEAEILAVTASSAREGVVLILPDGTALAGLPNCDRRGYPLETAIREQTNLYRLTGKWCDSLFSAFKIAGFRREFPDLLQDGFTFTSISEWIGYEMTGRIAIERSHACESALYRTAEDRWSEELVSLFGLEGMILPEVVRTGTAIGVLRDEWTEVLGHREKIPFLVTGGDTQAAIRGASGSAEGTVLVSGSTSPLAVKLQEPIFDPEERFWLDCNLGEGWLAETNTGASGINLQRYCEQNRIGLSLEEVAMRIRTQSSLRCIAAMGDKQFAVGRSIPQKGYLSLTGEPLTHIDRIAALWADTAFGTAENAELLQETTGRSIAVITGCGGGLRSDLLCQWIADASGRELMIPEGYDQATVQGCRLTCNEYYGVRESLRSVIRHYLPDRNSVLCEYRNQWKSLRESLTEVCYE